MLPYVLNMRVGMLKQSAFPKAGDMFKNGCVIS